MAKVSQKPSANAGAPLVVAQDKFVTHPSGEFIGTITDAVEVTASTGQPQIEAQIETDKGKIRMYFNFDAFKRMEDLSPTEAKKYKPCVLVNKDGEPYDGIEYASIDGTPETRVLDKNRQQECMDILGKALVHAGIPSGTKFFNREEICTALRGQEIGIHVEKRNGYARVRYTMFPDNVEQEA